MSAYGYKQTVCGVTRKCSGRDSNPQPTAPDYPRKAG